MPTNNTQRARSIVGSSEGRDSKDFYATPAWATQALLDREIFVGPIWEPACGNGAICEVLKKNHYSNVRATDLHDYGYEGGTSGVDFLAVPRGVTGNCINTIITNPPFNLWTEFLTQSLEHSDHCVALFGKLAFLEGVKRKKIFESSPLKSVYVFSKRVKLEREGKTYKNGSMMAFAWFVWMKTYTGKPTISWI